MTHFGIICPAANGHLNPMTTLGSELLRRGHRVTVFNLLDAKTTTLASGLEFQALAENEFPAGSMAEGLAQLGKLSGLTAFRYTIKAFTEISAALLTEAPTAIQKAGVEALLVDQVSFEGGTIAEVLNLPFVTVCSALMVNRDHNIPPFCTPWQYNPTLANGLRNQVSYELLNLAVKPIRDVIAQYRKEWKLPLYSHPNDGYSKLAQISQQPAEFEFPRQNLPPHFHFTGPYHNPATRQPVPFPFEQLTGKPLIYASMGTIQNRLLDVFQTIASACEGLDAQLVISLGGGATPESLPPLPGNPIVVGYAPQLELLQKAALTITHAGMNTTLESLSNGVPMVAIPVANDQPGVAARIAWTGVGEVVPLKELSVSKVRSAIGKVLTQESYKQRAIEMQGAIGRSGGTKRAADIIEQAVLTGKPVLAGK
ncbi:glycosyltransferase, MGT family [Oscillatoria nigro-viridis PCC 7112]|uniref:Glycosyltransferase, MGT family n=1 Tax=Phormidium nigroviride PCC 7112 TaxID=179408 RepID=K9VRR5_9CYAN|nr:glycosyltransferase [Oscillatoria nigro-viridis]AFZ10182.1 glycosyltransferase, MGT family [Oscillatoria nigro-viridis PCC 7112]